MSKLSWTVFACKRRFCLQMRSGPLRPVGCVGGHLAPVGSVGENALNAANAHSWNASNAYAFKMRSECVRMRSRNALKTRRMRSPEQPSLGAISGAFRGKFACFSDTHTFCLATRAQTFAVPRSGWGCCAVV